MSTTVVKVRTRVVALAASVALGAGSIVGVAPAATAAPGETAFFETGENATGIAEDADGNLWVTNSNDTAPSVSKVSLDGTVVTYPFPLTFPNAITRGSDGAMWVASFVVGGEQKIVRVAPDGSTIEFPLGTNDRAWGIATGPDGNLWFTLPDAKQVGKLTTRGVVTLYDTGATAFDLITEGPANSNRMYLTTFNGIKVGYITTSGAYTEIDGPANERMRGIGLINDSIWLSVEASNKLYKLVNDRGYSSITVPQLTEPLLLEQGVNGSMWVSQAFTEPTVNVAESGEALASYPSPLGVVDALIQARDGNLWRTVANGVERVLTGVVPSPTAAPAIEPATGLAAGTTVTASNGTWNYRPSSYAYQWQLCTSTEASTCADIAGATARQYALTATDVSKYLRVGVRATNLNGASAPAYSSLVSTGTAPNPNPNPNPTPTPTPTPTPVKATGKTATIAEGVTMEIDAPAKQKRKKRKFYEVVFSTVDVPGTVVFTFKKGKRTQTKTVTIEDGIAEYRWKTPKKWRKGRTLVTATYVPAAGSPYQAAAVRDRVRIR